jgi:DNA-binding NarL/FixJ family response regulator
MRILVADDFVPWCRYVSLLILPKKPEWQIVGEVFDGVEAVKKAAELRPDLILLDVGLPKLSGIEVARQIKEIDSDVKILFLSVFDSREIVELALSTGANGYVVKLDAGSELVVGMEEVLQGKLFVSSRLRGSISVQGVSSQASDELVRDARLSSRAISLPEAESTHQHDALFYSDDDSLIKSVTDFFGSALRFGNSVIAIASEPHRDAIVQELKTQGLNADVLIQQGAYVSLDAAELIPTLMINEQLDAGRFFESFKNLIESASKAAKAKHPRVAIFGEAAALLWAQGKKDAAIQLEQLGAGLARSHKVDILCAYPSTLNIREDRDSFAAICAEHSVVHSESQATIYPGQHQSHQ